MRRPALLFLAVALVAGCGGTEGSEPTFTRPPAAGSSEDHDALPAPADVAAAAGLSSESRPVQASPATSGRAAALPSVDVVVEPSEGGNLVYLPLAGKTSNQARQGHLALRFLITNTGAKNVRLRNVSLTFAGGNPAPVSIRANLRIDAGATGGWHFRTANNILLPQPAPASVEISLKFPGYDALKLTRPLAAHASPVAGGAFLFPSSASDLRVGEYWTASATTHPEAGDGGQLFAYDMSVSGWDPDKKAMTWVVPGGSATKNEDQRVWGKRIRAMADGTVVAFLDNQPTNPTLGSDLVDETKPGAIVEGNHFYIQHGDELVLYAHFQKGTLNASLMRVGANVRAGDYLGLAGNSGNSTGPHLHIHSIQGTQPWMGTTRPLPFRETWAIERAGVKPPDPAGAWTKLTSLGPPPTGSFVWPTGTAPAWYPPGYAELARHGVPASQYQTEFEKIYKSGYRPVWVDGFQAGGQNYFNAIFRADDGVGWSARHGLTGDQYQAEFNAQTKAGGRLLHVDSYPTAGGIRYASIFVSSGGPAWLAYHGRSEGQHQQAFNHHVQHGYAPVLISVTPSGGQRWYTALYEKKDVGTFWAKQTVPAADYQTEFTQQANAGRKLVYLNAYNDGAAGVRFTAIWHSKATWPYARHGLTSGQYQAEFDLRLKQGLLTRGVTGYDWGGQPYYAGYWTG
jgi:hypothetical protein